MAPALRAVLILLAGASLVSLLSPLVWVFDLTNHLRPQLLAASVALGVVAVFLRKCVGLALSVAVINGVLFGVPLVQAIGPGAPAADQLTLRILAANVWTGNRAYERLLDLVADTEPDIIVLSEIDRRWVQALEPLHDSYPHRMLHPRSDNFGLAAYATKPFEGMLVSNPEIAVPMLVLRFEGMTIINAHPVPPVNARAHAMNRTYLQEAVAQLTGEARPVILAGDLNTTLWGDAMAPILDAGFKTLNRLPLAYTWPADRPVLAMQIDHVLARGISAGRLEVLADIGSDHFPVLADVELP